MSSKIIAGTTSGTALNMSADTSGQLEIQTGATPTTAITVDASQNVGIGTSSPTTKLDVRGNGYFISATDPTSFWSVNSGLSTGSGYCQWNTTANEFRVEAFTNHPLVFGTNNSERMRVDNSGNLLIGTTSAIGKIALLWNSSSQQGFSFKTSSSTFNGRPILFYNNADVASGFITQAQNTVAYETSSDYRLKEDIAPMTGALDKVSALKPVTYKWKSDGSNGQGFIAHELQAVVPDCVTGEKDAVDAEGKPQYQGVDTSFLVATLTSAIQELNAKVDAQAAEIAALKGAK